MVVWKVSGFPRGYVYGRAFELAAESIEEARLNATDTLQRAGYLCTQSLTIEPATPQRKHAALKIRDFDLQVKSVGDDGTFTGYGSVFGNVDSYGEVVAAGAFTQTLADIKAKGRPVPILWQHNPSAPIGVYTALSQDSTGLFVDGQLLTTDVAQAREAYALLKAGAVSGLSIGYWVRESSYDEKTGIRTLTQVDLVECSLVTFPANDEARVDAVKLKLAHGQLPTIPEFELILREAGFSKSKSAVIANRGLKHLLRSESEGAANHAEALKELTTELSGFSLPSFSKKA